MPHLTCPTCKRELDVEEGVQARWITCPGCLTSLGSIQTSVTNVPAPGPRAITDYPANAEMQVCPNCGRDVERSWRFCPVCEAPLRSRRRPPNVPQLEHDVHRDLTAIHIGALVLGCLLVVGAACFFVFGGMDLVASDFGSAITAIVVLVGVILASLAAVAFGSRNKIIYGVTGALGGVLVGSAAVVIVVLLIIAAIIDSIVTACKCK